MKKILLVFLASFLLLSAKMNSGIAQSIIAGISNAEFTSTTDENSSKEKITTGEVNVKAIKNFEKSFKQVENVNWYKVKDGFMVYFFQDGTKKVSGYDPKGNWLYNLVSYNEEKLPRPVWHQVKSVYYEFSIVWVNQVQIKDKTIYVVHLENKETYKNVRVCDDEMDVIEEIKKS